MPRYALERMAGVLATWRSECPAIVRHYPTAKVALLQIGTSGVDAAARAGLAWETLRFVTPVKLALLFVIRPHAPVVLIFNEI